VALPDDTALFGGFFNQYGPLIGLNLDDPSWQLFETTGVFRGSKGKQRCTRLTSGVSIKYVVQMHLETFGSVLSSEQIIIIMIIHYIFIRALFQVKCFKLIENYYFHSTTKPKETNHYLPVNFCLFSLWPLAGTVSFYSFSATKG